ncbi:MAG: YceI family protein [Saprospiraceae bacterium]
MKQSIFLTALIILLGTSFLVGQTTYQTKKANVSVLGTSNLHDWEMTGTQASLKGTFDIENGALAGIENVFVEIPVKSIKSSKGSIMDGKTYDALKSDKHPKITFRLKNVNSINPKSGAYEVKATGDLTIAGYTKSVLLNVMVKVLPSGELEITGSKDLKMTEYKMEPPTAMFGALTTGDDVTIKFATTLTSNQLNK